MRFLSVDHTRSNQRRLGAAVGEESPLGYRGAVERLRGYPCRPDGLELSFESDDLAAHILGLGYFDDIFTNVRRTSAVQRSVNRALVPHALDVLGSADECLRELVELVITDVVFMPSDRVGGGSGSHLPGIVCVSPGDGWAADEMAETLLHEAVHLNAFLGEMVNGMYSVPIARLEADDARVLSAVRIGDLRPLDKALHSALVAVPLMYLQHLRGQSSLVDLFTDSLRTCHQGLLTKGDFFNEYGWRVVEDLGRFAQTLDYGAVWSGLRASDRACC